MLDSRWCVLWTVEMACQYLANKRDWVTGKQETRSQSTGCMKAE